MTHVACVIEPELNQLLGSYIQSLSLRSHPAPYAYHLVVVERSPKISAQFVRWAGDLGLDCRAYPSRSENPYLNRWLFLGAFGHLREAPHVVCLDWDIYSTSDRPLPGSRDGRVLGRRNPSHLYRDSVLRVKGTLPTGLVTDDGGLVSSVNGGVLIASGASLGRCAERHEQWAGRLSAFLHSAESWEQEQMALSVALGELGLVPLEDGWNVTPASPVEDAAVGLWHYNDSVEATRRLKRQLIRPKSVERICDELRGRWPRTIGLFEVFYAAATREMPFRAFLH